MSVDMHDSCDPPGEPTISCGGGPEGGPQGPRVTQQHHEHDSQTETILTDAKSLRDLYSSDASLQNTHRELITKFNAFLDIVEAHVKETRKENNNITEIAQGVRTLLERTQNPNTTSPTNTPNSRLTYSAIAAQANQRKQEEANQTEYNRKATNITVKINPETPSSLSKKPEPDILAALKRQLGKTRESHIVAVRKLPSGDFLITASSPETRKELEEDPRWTKTLATKSRIVTASWTVMIHFMPKSTSKTDPKLLLEEITHENRTYHSNFNLKRFSWPRAALANEKTYGSAILEFGSPEEANAAIEKGIIYQAERKDCELYSDRCKQTQCFNCYQYGHTARRCRNNTACGFCAARHSTNECRHKEDQTKKSCTACGTKGHAAWEKRCKKKEEEMNRVKAALAVKPRLYPISRPLRPTPNAVHSEPARGSQTCAVVIPKMNPTRNTRSSQTPRIPLAQSTNSENRKRTADEPMEPMNQTKTRRHTNKENTPRRITYNQTGPAEDTQRDLMIIPDSQPSQNSIDQASNSSDEL